MQSYECGYFTDLPISHFNDGVYLIIEKKNVGKDMRIKVSQDFIEQ